MPPYFPDYVLNPQSCHDDVHTDTVPGEAVPGEAVPGEAVPVEAVSVEAEPDNGDPDEVDSVEADAGDVIAEEDVDSGDESVKIYPYSKCTRNEEEFLKDEVELSDIKFMSVLYWFILQY